MRSSAVLFFFFFFIFSVDDDALRFASFSAVGCGEAAGEGTPVFFFFVDAAFGSVELSHVVELFVGTTRIS
jgi:hypothetical protein